MDDYDLGPLEVVVKEEPEELDFDVEPSDEENCNSNDSKRRRSVTDTFDCEMCPEMFLNHELLSSHYRIVHNTDPNRMYKRVKLDSSGKPKKKMRERENYECKNCQKQFCTKTLYLGHVNACTRKSVQQVPPTSILEAHLKNNNQIKREEPEPILCETNLNIPDFNLFEDINMQLSGQKPVPSLMPLGGGGGHSSSKSSKYSRKDSRKVYDESTNTECTCEVCGKQWPAKKHLWQHLIRFHRSEAAVTCGVCLKLCSTYEGLSEHLKSAHPSILSAVGNNFTCKICGRYHNARSKLLLHMSIHIDCKNFMCQRCSRNFDNEEKLKEHITACFGSRPTEQTNETNDQAAKEENEEKGSLIGDEEEPEENEYESEEENSDNDSSSDKSNDSDSSSNSNSSSDDDDSDDDEEEDGRSRNIDEESSNSKDSENVQETVPQEAETGRVMEENETISLGEEEEEEEEEEGEESADDKPAYEGLSESEEDDGYAIKKKHQYQQSTQQQSRFEMPQKEPMLVQYSDEEGPPALSPMLPMAIKKSGNENNEDSQDELQRTLSDSLSAKKDKSGTEAESSEEEAEESEDEVLHQSEELHQAEIVDPNSAFHVDNNSSNEGEEEQEMEDQVEEEQEVEEEQVEEQVEENEVEEVQVEDEDENMEHHGINEAEVLEVDESEMHNLNGTVLMLTNDADGNQILIERNMADLENDDSVHDVAQYVFQDGTSFALEDYEAIVQGQGDEDDVDHHGFTMDIDHHIGEEEVIEEEVGVDEEIGELIEEEVEQDEVVEHEEEVQMEEQQEEYEDELCSSAKS